jgi:hypothetical protein
MNLWRLGACGLLVVGCGPSYGSTGIKTPDQLLEEQEALGAEQLKKEKESKGSGDTVGPTQDEKQREWDQHQAELEMKRASRSAETCPSTVTEKSPKGKAAVALVFKNDGHVKSSSVAAPFDKAAVGKCVLRAMDHVIVPAYEGAEHSIEWEVDLTGGKKSGPIGASAKPADADQGSDDK